MADAVGEWLATTTHRSQLAATAGVRPGGKASGNSRDAYNYRAERIALPKGVDAQTIAAA